MRIGIVCYPTFGGSGVVATELGKALAQDGHQVHFISYDQPFRLDELNNNIFYHEVRMYNYPLFDYKPYELILTSKMVEVAKYEKLDLLHVHYAIPHASAAYLAQKILADQGVYMPYITTLHGTDITLVGKEASFEPVITFSINHSNAVTAVSESLKSDTYKFFEITRPIEVIPNFICPNHYNKPGWEKLRHFYAPNNEPILMHISNFRKVKRIDDVLKAFKIIRDKNPAKLILIGDGPERSKAESLCREQGTCGDVTFVGKLKETEQMLAMADIFLLPSETESFGLAALEAMASSTVVVSSNAGGLPEVNIHGETGFLHKVGDVEAIANYCNQLIAQPDMLKTMKEKARAHSLKFSINTIKPHYEAIYHQVLGR